LGKVWLFIKHAVLCLWSNSSDRWFTGAENCSVALYQGQIEIKQVHQVVLTLEQRVSENKHFLMADFFLNLDDDKIAQCVKTKVVK
jgi:hypothetical protein